MHFHCNTTKSQSQSRIFQMDQSERRNWYDAVTVVQNATWLIQTDQSETWMETRLTHSNGPIKNLDGNEADPFKRTNQKPGWKRGWPIQTDQSKTWMETRLTWRLDSTSRHASVTQGDNFLSTFQELTNHSLSGGNWPITVCHVEGAEHSFCY